MTLVPGAFAAEIEQRFGEAGRRWIAALPGLVAEVCETWGLELDGLPPRHGVWGLVYAVRGSEFPSVLKLSWPDDGGMLARSVQVLNLWNGRGAVRLLRSDLPRHALLLERLDSATTLGTVEIGEALPIAGRLLRRLAVPAPDDLPRLQDLAHQDSEGLVRRWEHLGRPLPEQVIERTRTLTADLLPGTGRLLVNWDLHWDNVLRGVREDWLAIDPQVLSGDLEYAVAQLLWWRLEEIEAAGGVPWALELLVGAASLDPARTRAWTYVRTVHYWLMGLKTGLTINPPRCQRVVAALDRLI